MEVLDLNFEKIVELIKEKRNTERIQYIMEHSCSGLSCSHCPIKEINDIIYPNSSKYACASLMIDLYGEAGMKFSSVIAKSLLDIVKGFWRL